MILSGDPALRFAAQAMAFAYAALIFSFLGGLWWGLAATSSRAPSWLWIAAVLPSLIALASAIPWAVGGEWPGPSTGLLGLCIVASLLVDRRLVVMGLAPGGWMALRVPLSLGLGGLTLLIAILS
jgi:hypothetical protein